ncbi:MAG: hypothetical protein WBF97_14185 [Comamonas sp.]
MGNSIRTGASSASFSARRNRSLRWPLPYLNRELAAVGFGEARIYDVRPSFKRWAELRGISADDIARVLGMSFVGPDLDTHRKLLEQWAEHCMSSR